MVKDGAESVEKSIIDATVYRRRYWRFFYVGTVFPSIFRNCFMEGANGFCTNTTSAQPEENRQSPEPESNAGHTTKP